MDGSKRREQILDYLSNSSKPMSASFLAGKLSVSRQIIVGDIALIRASGIEIIATARGYVIEGKQAGVLAKIAVCHDESLAEQELSIIVKLGGEVLDVVVSHELYGELKGQLGIRTQSDVKAFIKAYKQSNERLLSNLTSGIHLHTIRCDTRETVKKIEQALSEVGILYRD